jgi:hypothetical protein
MYLGKVRKVRLSWVGNILFREYTVHHYGENGTLEMGTLYMLN